MHVLDAGCGPGRLTLPIAKTIGPQGEVLALDIQAQMLTQLRKKVSAIQLRNISFLHAGLGEGKLPENTFDRALLVTVLGETLNPLSVLKEIYNSLKPGGILSLTETIFDPHFQTKKKVLELSNHVGFKEKNSFGQWFAYTLHLEKQ